MRKNVFRRAVCLVVLFMTMGVGMAEAQSPEVKRQQKREQLIAAQTTFIANGLDLSDSQKKQFADTYRDYKMEMWAVAPRRKGGKPQEDKTEAEAQRDVQSHFERSKQMLAIREKYYEKFSKFLSQKQIEKMYNMEHKMMQKFRQRAHTKKHGQRPPRPEGKDRRM